MKVSFNWLKQYIEFPQNTTPEELANRLTMSTVEVEGMKTQGDTLVGIVVGEIVKIDNHPNADKLKVCLVDDGQCQTQVVCGGSNIKENMKIAFAPVGVFVRWHGQGELVELQKAKIRGVESNGMICASSEIGLGEIFLAENETEVLNLDFLSAKPGTLLSEALEFDDKIFDIDNKSMTHRPDLWGHYGLAREISALYGLDLAPYNPSKIKAGKEMEIKVKVDDHKLCPRYMAVAIDGVKVESSPLWMQKKLLAVGLRPINNIVDITNYVLLDLGQPMHAFDADYLTSDKTNQKNIFVRRAKEGEKFVTLDDKKYQLDAGAIVVSDNEKAVALGGVMGGLNSGITNKTTIVVYESANFDATTIRQTSVKLGLRTDSSARFEKSLDPNNAELAIRRAVQLTLELCPTAKVISNLADSSDFTLKTGPIALDWDFLRKKLGQELPKKQVVNILTGLGFGVKETRQELLVKVPTWRATKDISIPEDLVEEVARIYGYDNIQSRAPLFAISPPEVNESRQLERHILDILVKDLGYNEVLNYSFVSLGQIKNLRDDPKKYIELANPISKEKPFLRRNLLLNLLENVVKNIEFYDEVRLCEIGKTFLAEASGIRADKNNEQQLPRQNVWLTALFASKNDTNPFWQSRRVLEKICNYFNLNYSLNVEAKIENWRHPARFGGVVINGMEMGTIYEIHPMTAKNFGLEIKLSALDINLNKLSEVVGEGGAKYQALPVFPEVVRDLAIIVKNEVNHSDVLKTLSNFDPILKRVEIFDAYEGKNIGEGYKSLAYHLTYSHPERTLTAEEVDVVQERAVEALNKKLHAQVRQ